MYRNLSSIISVIKCLCKILSRNSFLLFVFIMLFTIATSILSPFVAIALSQLVSSIQSFEMLKIVSAIAGYIDVQLTIEIIENIVSFLNSKLNLETANDVKNFVINELSKKKIEYIEESEKHDVVNRIKNNMATGMTGFLNMFFVIVSPTVSIVSISIIMFNVSWLLPLILLGANIATIINIYYQIKWAREVQIKASPIKRYAQYIFNSLTARSCTKDIRIFNALAF